MSGVVLETGRSRAGELQLCFGECWSTVVYLGLDKIQSGSILIGFSGKKKI